MSSPAHRILAAWERWHRLPGGRWLFSRMLGTLIPYTGTIRPRVLELGPGRARVALQDHRAVRNHLNSIHAIALANLGEVTGGLALTAGLPLDVRGILTGLKVEYLKKARGSLEAVCNCVPPPVFEPTESEVHTEIRDASGEVVARVSAQWRLSPVPRSSARPGADAGVSS